jgi:hypothetical protein
MELQRKTMMIQIKLETEVSYQQAHQTLSNLVLDPMADLKFQMKKNLLIK